MNNEEQIQKILRNIFPQIPDFDIKYEKGRWFKICKVDMQGLGIAPLLKVDRLKGIEWISMQRPENKILILLSTTEGMNIELTFSK